MKHWLPIVFAAIVFETAAAAPPTELQQRLACTGDAIRLCAAMIPDRAKIRACMLRLHDRLSDRCRPVFDASIAAGE